MPALAGVDDRTVATAIAGARIAIGTSFLGAPGLALRVWPGRDASRPIARSLARSLGGRDLALGLGTLFALKHERGVRGWLEAGMLADGVDAVAIVLAWRHLPRWRAVVVLGGAAGAVVVARRLAGNAG